MTTFQLLVDDTIKLTLHSRRCAHATNENATWLSVFNIVIFGLLFGTGYVLTGELALPIGLHFGWDFVQGFVFGVVAEGNNTGRCSSSPITRRRGSDRQASRGRGRADGDGRFHCRLPGNIRVGAISTPRSPAGHPFAPAG